VLLLGALFDMPSTLEGGVSAQLQMNDAKRKPQLPFNHQTVHSWSTTDGETSSSNGEESDSYQGLGQMDDPYMYPSPFIVKNTFIDCESAGPTFDEFYRAREAKSCPASKMQICIEAGVEGLADVQRTENLQIQVSLFDGDLPSKNTFVHFPVAHIPLDLSEERRTKSCPSSGVEMAGWADHGAEPASFISASESGMENAQSRELQYNLHLPFAVMPVGEHLVGDQFVPTVWVHMETAQPSRAVLSLASALPEPEVGSLELPSIGSAGHWNGICKPCAFMARGCSSGLNCPFCHLCDVNEKKRRRKDKIAFMRELRRWKKEQAVGASGDQYM